MVREELERPGASGEGSRKTGSPSGGDAATARMRWNEYLHSATRSRPGASGENYSEVLVMSSRRLLRYPLLHLDLQKNQKLSHCYRPFQSQCDRLHDFFETAL